MFMIYLGNSAWLVAQMFNCIPKSIFPFLHNHYFCPAIVNSHSAGDFPGSLATGLARRLFLPKTWWEVTCATSTVLASVFCIPHPSPPLARMPRDWDSSYQFAQSTTIPGGWGGSWRKPSGSWRASHVCSAHWTWAVSRGTHRFSFCVTSDIFPVCFHHSSSVFALSNLIPGTEDENPTQRCSNKGQMVEMNWTMEDWTFTHDKDQGKGRSERKVLGINNSHSMERVQNGNSEKKKKAEEFSSAMLLLKQ